MKDRKRLPQIFCLTRGFPTRFADPYIGENAPNFHVLDADGNEIHYGISDDIKGFNKRVYSNINEGGENIRITFEAVLPPCGYAEYKVVPNYESAASRYMEKMLLSGTNYAENQYIRFEITPHGEIDLLDKKTGKKYSNLCELYDDSECGDGWYHGQLLNDFELSSKPAPARIEKLEESPSRVVFRVYNASDKNTEGRIVFDRSPKAAYETNLNEEARSEVKLENDNVPVALSPWKIATYKVIFE